MKTRIVWAILLGIVACIFAGLAIVKTPPSSSTPKTNTDNILVTTSFYPLADFATKIGQDKVNVINITPPGSEPHDYEPSPKDLAEIYSSKVFIYNGVGLETWVDKILPDLISKNIIVIQASSNIDIYGTATNLDPHLWLDPVFAQKMVVNIRNGFQKADPGNINFYAQNSDALIVKLVNLDQTYLKNLYNCKQKDVVTSHDSLGYLSRRYHFQTFSISGLSPDQEPSPQKMADITNLIKQLNVKYILTETLVSPKLANTLAIETKVNTLVFNPIEGLTTGELSANEDYLSVQEKNIKSLSTALECQKL